MSGGLRLSDTELIFLILAVIYLAECGCWLRGTALCFTSGWRRHRLVEALLPLQHESGRLVFTSLWPWARSFVCQAWPIPLDPHGLVVGSAGSQTEDWLTYDQVRSVVQREREVRVNGRLVAALTSEPHAEFVTARLQRICQAPAADRQRVIGLVLDETQDTEAVARRLALLQQTTASLRDTCTMFLVFAFVVGPVLYYLPWPVGTPAVWMYGVGFVALWLMLIFQYYAVRRAVCAEPRSSRLWHTCLLLLSPGSAMRTAETVSRNFLAPFHPLAAACVLCAPARLAEFAERTLRDLRHPLPDRRRSDASPAARAVTWFQQELLVRAERAVSAAGLDPAALLVEPPRSPDARSYCPRCATQYVFPEGVCATCHGLPLVPYAARADRVRS